MDDLEHLVNLHSDNDAEWYPFLFVRPEAHERMSDARVLVLATLYGGFVGALADVLLALRHAAVNPAVFPLAATLALFVVLRLTVAWAWNRRADRDRLAGRAVRG